MQAVEAARTELANAADEEARRLLDPLAAPSVASPLTPDVARIRTAPAWEKWRFLIGAAAGGAIGVALFFARDIGSDARCLAWAKAKNDVPSYEKYLSRGRRHTELVAKELLPRAALREAVAKGSVEAIDDFARAHPGTKVQGEIDAARNTAVLAELERAKKTATFASVLGFGEKYPDKRKDPSFVQAKHALYARALERYLKETHEQVADILKRLVAAAEKVEPKKTDAGYKGAVVEVRVRRMPVEGDGSLRRPRPQEPDVQRRGLAGDDAPRRSSFDAAREGARRGARHGVQQGLRSRDPRPSRRSRGSRTATASSPIPRCRRST